MADIGKGDWVICINANGPVFGSGMGQWLPEERLTQGAIYQIADCFTDQWGLPAVDLVGKIRRRSSTLLGRRVGYAVERFRPLLGGPDQELSETLLEPIEEHSPKAPVKTREVA